LTEGLLSGSVNAWLGLRASNVLEHGIMSPLAAMNAARFIATIPS